MIVDRTSTPGLAQVAYLVADEHTGAVAVIDPRRNIDAYLEWAARNSMRVTAILETHVHADFVSGSIELAGATGAPIYASRLGNQDFEYLPLEDGDEVQVGNLTLRALWTPGHTPEHLVYLLIDPNERQKPVAMFSGDLLFVGEVGRPDLLGEEETHLLAEQLYETFTNRLDGLPDDLTVYPGHTGGSSCGKNIGDAPHTTLGQERLFNYALQHKERDAFIDAVMGGMPAYPTYYPYVKAVNKAGAKLVSDLDEGSPLSVDAVEQSVEQGAVLIDARSTAEFDQSHIPGAFYAGDGHSFINWVGWLAPYARPIVLLLTRDATYEHYRNELRRIGLDLVVGFLEDGIDAWEKSGRAIKTLDSISPSDLHEARSVNEEIAVVDVRTDDEWESGHILGAIHQFAGDIISGSDPGLDGKSRIVLACATGYRSRVAASLLETRGYHNLVDLQGGMDVWRDAGFPMVAT